MAKKEKKDKEKPQTPAALENLREALAHAKMLFHSRNGLANLGAKWTGAAKSTLFTSKRAVKTMQDDLKTRFKLDVTSDWFASAPFAAAGCDAAAFAPQVLAALSKTAAATSPGRQELRRALFGRSFKLSKERPGGTNEKEWRDQLAKMLAELCPLIQEFVKDSHLHPALYSSAHQQAAARSYYAGHERDEDRFAPWLRRH